MFRRFASILAVALAALAIASLAPAANAGGHVDIKASAMPANIEAGKTVPVTFTIAWPGGEPVSNAHPIVVAKLGNRRLEVAARRTKRSGEYIADVKLPAQGAWTFVVDSKICGNTCTLSPVMAVAAVTAREKAASQ